MIEIREREKKTLKTIKIFHFEVEWLCLLDFFSTMISLNLDWLQFSKWVYRSINQFDTVNRNVILYPNIVHLPKCICPVKANTSTEFQKKKCHFFLFFVSVVHNFDRKKWIFETSKKNPNTRKEDNLCNQWIVDR